MNITAIINSIKASLPVGTTEAELAKVLTNLGVIPAPIPVTPATPIAPVPKSTIDSINESIDKLIASEAITNNGGNNMNGFTIAGTTTAQTPATEATISWKAIPEFAILAHTVNDCKSNRMTWFKFFTASFDGIGFNNITKFNSQVSALSGLYPDDTELRTAAEIIGIIGTIIKWGDIDQFTLRNFGLIQDTYLKVTTTPANKTQLIAELVKTIEGYADILNEDERTYNDAISFFGESFLRDCKTVAKLRNISKIGNNGKRVDQVEVPAVTKSTNNNCCTKKNK